MKNKAVAFFEIHYLFNDNSHTIDAFVRNQCEKELLQIFHHSFKEVGLNNKVKIESIPSKKGSFLDGIQFSTEAIGFATLIFAGLSLIYQILSKPKESELDKKLKQKQIESTELEIEQKRLEIEKLKKELENNNDLESIENRENIERFMDLFLERLILNPVINRHISNFYQNLIDYDKVQSMEYTPYDQNHQAIMGSKTIHREDFHKFILQTSEDEIIDENAKIYIHSPILVKGRKHWSGYYTLEEQVINFSMSDKDFKNDVTNGTIKFANGSFICARLRKTLKFDDFGNIKNQKYTVELVTKVSNDNGYAQETKQGKAYKEFKDTLKKQLGLEFNDS